MNSNKSPLEQWLAETGIEQSTHHEVWDPGFDGGRQIVIVKIGPYHKMFQRPPIFNQRFYHKVYPLPIEDWQIRAKTQLYGDLCLLETVLSIRFQATVKYAEMHFDNLPDINRHIKASAEIVIRDAIDQELQSLDDGIWIDSGLSPIEKRIQTRINEVLIMQQIQCRTLCEIHPTFKDINNASTPDDPFTREDIYLKVLKKNFEFQERKNKERFLQEQEQERLRLEQQQRLLEQRNKEEELKRQEQALSAEAERHRLEERERQLAEQFQIEQRLHLEQVEHQTRLKELEQEAFRELERRQQARQFEIEQQLLEERLKHQQQLKEQERSAELKEFEEQQAKWNAAKERMQLEKIAQENRLKQMEAEALLKIQEIKLTEEQKLQERLRQEQLKHESRMREMELELEVEEQKRRHAATQETDEYLRRDIELLILEKQRTELLHAVKKARTEPEMARQLPSGLENDE